MSVKIVNIFKNDFDTLILPVSKDGKFEQLPKDLNDKINKYIKYHSFSPEKDKILDFELEFDDSLKQIILVTLDRTAKENARSTIFKAFAAVSKKSKNILFFNSKLSFDEYIITEIFTLGNYKFEKYINNMVKHKFNLWILSDQEADLSETLTLSNAVLTARDLVNEPANILYPKTLAEAAAKLGEEFDFEVEVLDK